MSDQILGWSDIMSDIISDIMSNQVFEIIMHSVRSKKISSFFNLPIQILLVATIPQCQSLLMNLDDKSQAEHYNQAL